MITQRKPDGYWTDWTNVETEINKIKRKYGELPAKGKLCELGYSSLCHAINGHHGGFHTVRQKIGESPLCVKKEHWKPWKTVEKRLNEIIKETGDFPTKEQLSKRGESGLNRGLFFYHGGLRAAKEKMGYEAKQPKGYWKDIEHIKEEVRAIMRKHDFEELPTSDWLNENGYASIGVAIARHGRGFPAFRKTLGQDQKRISNGLWKTLDYTIQQVQQIMRDHDFEALPSQNWFKENGYTSLSSAIEKYHGGYHAFRGQLGQQPKRLPSGSWKDEKYVLTQAQQIMRRHKLMQLPSQNWFNGHGYSSFSVAIIKYHGGLPAFRRKLSQHLGIKDDTENLEGLLNEYAA